MPMPTAVVRVIRTPVDLRIEVSIELYPPMDDHYRDRAVRRFARTGHSADGPFGPCRVQAPGRRPTTAAAAARVGKSSFTRILATWRFTVCSLSDSFLAMAALLRPSARNAITSRSRALKSSSVRDGAGFDG